MDLVWTDVTAISCMSVSLRRTRQSFIALKWRTLDLAGGDRERTLRNDIDKGRHLDACIKPNREQVVK